MKDRVLIKHDIAANWAKAVNFVPMAGELIIYDGIIEDGVYLEQPKIKVGDGLHKLAELPFLNIEKQENDYQYDDGVLKLK